MTNRLQELLVHLAGLLKGLVKNHMRTGGIVISHQGRHASKLLVCVPAWLQLVVGQSVGDAALVCAVLTMQRPQQLPAKRGTAAAASHGMRAGGGEGGG